MPNIDHAFRVEKLSLNDNVLVVEGTIDPSTGAGYEAPVGSLFIQTGTGNVYVKFGPADIEWRLFSGINSADVTTALGYTPGTGNGTVTSVAASGGTTGMTFTESPITTSGTLTLTGTLIAANGGTGQSSYAVGDILYANTTTTLAKLSVGADGQVLTADSAETTGLKWATPLDDASTTSTTQGWSASKLNSVLGDIDTALAAIIG